MTLIATLLLYAAVLSPIAFLLAQFLSSPVVRAVFWRNLMSYFSSVLGYLFIVVFVVVGSFLAFSPQFFANNLANLDQLTQWYPDLLLFLVPAITMSTWADERKQGTDELLFTLPATDIEILIGKYLSVLAVYTAALVFSMMHWAVLSWYADPGLGLFVSTYLGYWLAGASLLAGGMLASSLTRSATVAFVLGGIICAIPVYLESAVDSVMSVWAAIRSIPAPNTLQNVSDWTFAARLREFSQGVIPLNSVFYFEAFAVFALYLNYVVIKKRHWSATKAFGMSLQFFVRAIAVAAVLIAINIIGSHITAKADLTPAKYYTLSPATLNVLESIDEDRPVTVQAFVSPESQFPRDQVETRKRLLQLLREIERYAEGRVNVRVVEVEPFAQTVEEAERFEITPRDITVMEDGRQESRQVFMGLTFESSYDTEIIPWIGPATPLEYEITRSLRTVSNTRRLTVGILETDAGVMQNDREWAIVEELRHQYEVKSISPDEKIEAEAKVFQINPSFATALDNEELTTDLRQQFSQNDFRVAADSTVQVVTKGKEWKLTDALTKRVYRLKREAVDKDEEAGDENPGDVPETIEVHTRSLDVLIAVMPSSLTAEQMPNLLGWIDAGEPTLLFDDPVPVMSAYGTIQPLGGRLIRRMGLEIAPRLPKPTPGGGMMGMQQPPPPAKADNGKLSGVLRELGLAWDNGEVVWDKHNPLRALPWLPYECVFVDGEHYEFAFNQDSKVSKGLQCVMLMYPGSIRSTKRGPGKDGESVPIRDDRTVTNLMVTSQGSGLLDWDEFIDTGFDPRRRQPGVFLKNPLGQNFPSFITESEYQPDTNNHVLAVRVTGDDKDPVNAIFVSDIDVIGDMFFQIRQQDPGFDFDNVTFVLNCVDRLAGVEDFLELRRRKPPSARLAELEKETKGLRKAQEATAKELLEKLEAGEKDIQERYDAQAEKIEKNEELRESEKSEQLARLNQTREASEENEKEKLRQKHKAELRRLNARYQRQIRQKEKQFRWWAIVVPGVPAILLGMMFLGWRVFNEQRDVPANRRR